MLPKLISPEFMAHTIHGYPSCFMNACTPHAQYTEEHFRKIILVITDELQPTKFSLLLAFLYTHTPIALRSPKKSQVQNYRKVEFCYLVLPLVGLGLTVVKRITTVVLLYLANQYIIPDNND